MALIKEVSKETLQREWRVISLVFAELIVLVLIVFQVLQLIGLHVNLHLGQVILKPSFELSVVVPELVVLAMAIVVFVLLYFAVKKRQPMLYLAQKMAPSIIKQQAKQKLGKVKEPQAPALLLIEVLFIAVVILALRAFFDPEIELIPWSRLGLGPPLTTVVNVIISLVVLGIFYYLYGFTALYRKK